MSIVFMGWAARPHDADLGSGKFREGVSQCLVFPSVYGRNVDVRYVRRNRLQRGLKDLWKTQQWGVGIELRYIDLAGFSYLTDAGNGREDRHQIGSADEHDFAASVGDHRKIARELKGIARALFGMDQDGAVGNRSAVPLWVGTDKGGKLAGLPSPLVFAKPPLKLAGLQQGHAKIEVGSCIVWLESDRPLVVFDGLLCLAPAAVQVAQAVLCLCALTFAGPPPR